jgi:hypothetical protein
MIMITVKLLRGKVECFSVLFINYRGAWNDSNMSFGLREREKGNLSVSTNLTITA